jgi:NitT/TauT family transport system substrate-binding protein
MNKMKMIASAMLTVALSGISASALAEGKISIAQQFGIGYLILDVVRDQQLIEKEGKKRGSILRLTGAPFPGRQA